MRIFTREILLTAIVVFGISFLAGSASAVAPDVEVIFEKTPLFKETNFVPGDSVSRWIEATNNAGENLKVTIRTANQSDPDHMSDFMGLKIKVGGAVLHDITVAQFLSGNDFTLPDLRIGATAQYDLEVSFDSLAGDQLQGKGLSFNIVLDFVSTSGILTVIDTGGGGGGGGYYLTPTPTASPSPTPIVAGAATTGGGQGSGLAQGGGIIGGTTTAAGEGGETPSPTPGAMIAGQETSCSQSPWWPFGYVLLLLILGTVQKMAKKVSVGGIVLQIALLIAALLWWWLEPCGAHFWVWPVLILIVFLVSLRFYLRKSSAGEIPA